MILSAIAGKLKRRSEDDFKGSYLEAGLIVQAVSWYLRYPLSYRDVEELLMERGLEVDHSTVNRWVLAYAPLIERRLRPFRRSHGGSIRVDETYVRIRGEWRYLYRAIDKHGEAVEMQLEADPGPWSCPWHRDGGGLPRNALTRQSYRGINILSLWIAERGQDFASGRWATSRQWQALGAQVRKGEKGTAILFYKDLPHWRDADAEGPRFVARASSVFNAAQVDGAPEEAAPHQADGAALASDLDDFAAQTGTRSRPRPSAAFAREPRR